MPKAIKTSVSLIDYRLDINYSSTISTLKQGLSIERVKNLYHMLKTLVGQCRIYLHTKSTFKIYD